MIAAAAPPLGVSRLFRAGAEADYSAHAAAYGPPALPAPGSGFVDELAASGLIGRGGAGFPAWRKVAATAGSAAHSAAARPVVIANGAEGEPRSSKDATLLRHAPHLVLDGLLAVAAAIGTQESYLYTSEPSVQSVTRAIRERRDTRAVSVIEAPDTFISGEASAVVNAIERGRAFPTDRTHRLSEVGLRGRPTLVFNVETLAHLGLVARFGPDWFRSVGTARDPGTRLVTLSGDVPSERVLEVAGDIGLGALLEGEGVDVGSLRGVLVGGYHGVWLGAGDLDTPLSPAGLAPFGGHPGAGIVFVLGSERCPLTAAAEITEYLGAESAGQCGPCMFGLPAMASLMRRLAQRERDPALVDELRRLAAMVSGRGSCHHPDGTTRLALSTITVFADEVDRHLAGLCSARTLPEESR